MMDSPTDALDAMMTTCADAGGLGGIGVPTMSVATASSTYTTYTPDKAIDGDINTAWCAGTNQGWLQIDFPAPTSIAGVRIAAVATPSTTQTFTITPSGSQTVIGSGMRAVNPNVSVLPAISVTPGTYSGIRITVDGANSWIQPYEVSLLTPACP